MAKQKLREKDRDPYDALRPWSALTHGFGAVMSVVCTLWLLLRTCELGGGARKYIGFTVYGLSMLCLYTASTLYHCLRTSVRGRVALKKYDHISIYLLIAGTYTPVCLVVLPRVLGNWLLGVIWALALAGTVMTLCWVTCPRWLSSTVYIAMGWIAAAAIYPIWKAVGTRGIAMLITGGLIYTVGGVLYALKWPGRNNPRFGCHEIFHVLILLGSAAMFTMIAAIVLPA